MIAGHLQIKNDYYYMVLSYLDANGKRKQPWFPTGLPIKNNKKRAEKMLLELRQTYVPPAEHKSNGELSADMLFADYMELWLEVVRNSIEITTFSSYTQMVKGKIVPYFRKTGVKLGELQARHIQSFYLYELKTVCPNTVIHEHANIHKALKYAVKMDLIPFNPADKVERPKKQRYIADYYRQEELERLLEASKDHPYSLLIQMTAFYGLRRSEALGLKWDAIDFERDTITIKHIVTNAKIDGKCEIVCADRAKTKSSLRSLPLVSNIREKLLALREQQKENRRVCGNCYSKKYDGYVFVDAMGNILNPRSVTANFSKLLEQNGLRHIRFHDLRHSCASLLLANDVPLKQIQEWLGHSDIGTTANIYSHLDYKSKITSANVMDNILTLPDTGQTGWHT
ncbi:site-specific integrase [Hominenteromicrobium sp.]|uniref:site-specific integrase n=1 Tax=Hominenteromicrobium sp. TaxID=3073581 RepID=UPI003AF07AA7